MSESKQQSERSIGDGLRLLHRNLQIVRGGIVVAVAALEYQNADRDKDIALVLAQLVGDRLADQIERTAELMTALATSRAPPPGIEEQDGPGKPRDVRESSLRRRREFTATREVPGYYIAARRVALASRSVPCSDA